VLASFFFIAVLTSFFVTSFFHHCASSLFLVAILASLPSRCFSSLFSLLYFRCSRYFFSHRCPCCLFSSLFSRCSSLLSLLTTHMVYFLLLFFAILIRQFLSRIRQCLSPFPYGLYFEKFNRQPSVKKKKTTTLCLSLF